ncbi:hypothetical protein ACLQ28_34090 [Micromonospora sp. DT201]
MLFEDLLLTDQDGVIDAIAVVVLGGVDMMATAEELQAPGRSGGR